MFFLQKVVPQSKSKFASAHASDIFAVKFYERASLICSLRNDFVCVYLPLFVATFLALESAPYVSSIWLLYDFVRLLNVATLLTPFMCIYHAHELFHNARRKDIK